MGDFGWWEGGGEGLVFQISVQKNNKFENNGKTSKHRILQQEEICTFIIWLSGELGTPSVYTFQQRNMLTKFCK